ncbi:MAG: AsmA family protein [Polaromonas sp.]|nr:AsmA family protein [Polaromonas sp.]
MNKPTVLSSTFRRWIAGLVGLIVVLALLVLFFPWDLLRGPINRYVTDQLGRRFEITQHLSVNLGRTTTVRADGIEFANPDWASEPYLVKARAAEFEIKLWPLLFGKVELPRVSLIEPQIGLQLEPDGRRTWALSRDTSDTAAVPNIGALIVDKGTVKYRAVKQGADISAQFSIEPESSGQMPLSYKASGKWRNEAFTASGRTGGVLQLSKDLEESFPIEVNAQSGKTSLKAKGSIANLAEFAGLDAAFDIQGRNLEELYKLAGVVLPSTPPYKLRGKLSKQGKVWAASQIQGVLGSSDISGALSFDTSGPIALLTGKVQSKLLDFVDLRPVIGLPVAASPTKSGGSTLGASSSQSSPVKPVNAGRKVLPTATLDLVRLKAMNADVTYSAADIRHVEQLPLDRGNVHVKLTNGLLQLDPISLGVAGGSLAGKITIDANVAPAAFDTRLDVRAVQLNKLFPTIQTTKSSFGKISGQFDLKGRGNSAAQMLGSASGDVAVLMGKGELSNILLEFIGLDGGEVIKFLLRGDRNVQLRCAAAAFNVKQGLMTSKTIMLDTSDTVINGSGQISLANETLDINLNPLPKDRSILSLRSPLKISGTFSAPSVGPDKLALAGRAGLALALGLVNPLLALAATVETGPGQDADCRGVLLTAAVPKTKLATIAKAAQLPASAAASAPVFAPKPANAKH